MGQDDKDTLIGAGSPVGRPEGGEWATATYFLLTTVFLSNDRGNAGSEIRIMIGNQVGVAVAGRDPSAWPRDDKTLLCGTIFYR